jgi:poly(3-hydroxybutyrate) depolymerase
LTCEKAKARFGTNKQLKRISEMNETNHLKHRYQGAPNEQVTIKVTATGTTHMVTYVLNDKSHALPAGTPITFNLGDSSGDLTRLQLIMDYNAAGSYEIIIEKVVDCQASSPVGTCKHTREGPPLVIENYKFSVV